MVQITALLPLLRLEREGESMSHDYTALLLTFPKGTGGNRSGIQSGPGSSKGSSCLTNSRLNTCRSNLLCCPGLRLSEPEVKEARSVPSLPPSQHSNHNTSCNPCSDATPLFILFFSLSLSLEFLCDQTTVNKKVLIHYIIPINDMVHRPLYKNVFKKSTTKTHDKAIQANILWLNLNKISGISTFQSAHKQGNPSFHIHTPG